MTPEQTQPSLETSERLQPPLLNEAGEPRIDPSEDKLEELRFAREYAQEQDEAEVFEEALEDLAFAWLQLNYPAEFSDLLAKTKKRANLVVRGKNAKRKSDPIIEAQDDARNKIKELYTLAENHLLSLLD